MREYSGPDAACAWPPETERALNLSLASDAQHLSDDAEKAEDISVRYGDGHSRPMNAGGPTIAEYREVRADCLAMLFERVAATHHVSVREVRSAINTHRRVSLDVLVMVSFGAFYVWVVGWFARGIWRRFPPSQDFGWGVAATVAISPVAALLGTAVGGYWAWYVETLRIGYGHLVERVDRIPWNQHLWGIFGVAVVIFLGASWWGCRSAGLRKAPSSTLRLGIEES